MFRLKKKQLFFPVAAILATAGVVFFVSYGSSQVTNRAVLDISLSSDNYDTSSRTFFDRSGLGNDGISANNALFSNGKYGSVDGAMNFNGTSDYIDFGNAVNMGLNDMTIFAWVKRNSSSAGHIVTKSRAAGQTNRYWVKIQTDGVVGFGASWSNGGHIDYLGEIPLSIGEWYFITIVVDRDGYLKIFINGEFDKSYNISTYANVDVVSDNPFRIGAYTASDNVTPTSFFNGEIEEVKILNYALSDEEVKNLYDNGRPIASGSNLNKGLVGHWRLEKGYDREEVQNFACNPFTYYSTYHTLTQEGTTLIFTMKDSAPYLVARDASLGAMHGRTFAYSGYMKKNGVPYVPPSNRINTYNTASDILYYQADPTTGYFEAVMYFSHETTAWHFHWPITKETGDVITIENFQLEESDHVTEYAECSSPSKVSDSTPNSNHGTIFGATFVEDRFGKEGGAMSFDGSGTNDGVIFGNHIVVPENITDTRNCPDGCTYSLWLNVDTDAVDRMSLFRGASTLRHIEIYSSGKKFRTEAGLQNGYSFGTGNFPYDVRGTWSHFVIVFANNEPSRPVRWYQNGELFHTGYMTSGTYPDTEYFSFGSIGRSTGSTGYNYAPSFDGSIDDVRIYNRALSESEIRSLYDSYNLKTTTGTLQQGLVLDMPLKLDYTKSETAGSEIMTDRTPYSNDGQNYGATVTSDSSIFNGSGNRIQLSKPLGIGDNPFTFSHWIKTTQGSGQTYTLGNTGSGNGYRFGIAGGKVAFLIGSSGYTESRCGTLTVNDGEWHMITGVFNRGDKFYCYVDGNLSGSVNILQYIGMNDNAPGIGAPPCCNDFAGEMSNLLIYNRALSGDEIKTLYDRGRSDAGIIFTPKN
jgi:hypothetical protein